MNLAHMQMQPQAVQQPTPTEKSQIVCVYTEPQMSSVLRFNTVKKGKDAYDKLRKHWSNWHKKRGDIDPLIEIEHDMFTTTVDVSTICSLHFCDHAKRAKFVPIP